MLHHVYIQVLGIHVLRCWAQSFFSHSGRSLLGTLPNLLRRLHEDLKRLLQMLLISLCIRAHHPNGIYALDHGAGEEYLPLGVDFLVHQARHLVGSFQVTVCGLGPFVFHHLSIPFHSRLYMIRIQRCFRFHGIQAGHDG